LNSLNEKEKLDMSKNLSHEEIAQRFVDGKAFDFHAIGKLVTELGPTLAVSDLGFHGVAFGRFNILACMMPAFDAASLIGNLRSAGLAETMLEGAARSK
jgi:hypothetical protein